jgi:hypothetical protein
MAKQNNTGVEIGLTYRSREKVHVQKMVVREFEDFSYRGIYFTSSHARRSDTGLVIQIAASI